MLLFFTPRVRLSFFRFKNVFFLFADCVIFSPHFVLFILRSSNEKKRQCKKQIKSCDKFLMNLKRCHDPRRAPVSPPTHRENPSTTVWHFVWPINANEPDIYSRLSLSFFSPFLALIFYLFVCVFCFFFVFWVQVNFFYRFLW